MYIYPSEKNNGECLQVWRKYLPFATANRVYRKATKFVERGFEGGIVLPVVFASLILSCRLLESVKNKMQKKAFFLLFNPVVLSWLIVLIMKDNKESK